MAVALDVGWAAGKLGNSFAHINKKRDWGDDQQKLLEMMLGKPFDQAKHTLDLLGSSSTSSASIQQEQEQEQERHQQQQQESEEFLELGPDAPLPVGWEKRLDLKSGLVFFTDCNTGKSTYDDPRKHLHRPFSSPSSSPPLEHISLELLQSELWKEQAAKIPSMPRSKEADDHRQHRKQQQQQHQLLKDGLDLKLNLSAATEDASVHLSNVDDRRSSCLWFLPSKGDVKRDPAVMLTGCKRCLMYVMISRSDPRCPKCGCSLATDLPIAKRPRFDLKL